MSLSESLKKAEKRFNPSQSMLLFCFLFIAYSLTIHAQLRYGDETERYLQAQSIIDRASFEIPKVPGHQTLAPNGKNYSQFEMGYGALLIPPYLIGRIVSDLFAYTDRDWIPLIFVSLFNPLVTALTAVVHFRLSRALGVADRIALFVALMFGLGTIAWPYTKGLYREPLQALTLLVAVYAAYQFRQAQNKKMFWLAAISFGYLVFTKIGNLIMLPIFLGYFLFCLSQSQNKARITWVEFAKQSFLFILPSCTLLLIQGMVNYAKYGDFLTIGPANYRDPLPLFSFAYLQDGLTGLLFSIEKGFFPFSPPTILLIPAIVELYRKHRMEAVFILVLITSNILFNGAYQLWGSVNWGPRYLVLIVPLALLPIGLLLDASHDRKRTIWWLCIFALFLIGIVFQIIAALVDDREIFAMTGKAADLYGVFDHFMHRAIDSLVISIAPTSGAIVINNFGWTMLILELVVLWLMMPSSAEARGRLWQGWGLLIGVLFLQMTTMMIWVVAVYPQVREAKANTKYVAADSYFSEGRYCDAGTLYLNALFEGTRQVQESRARVEQIAPNAQGQTIELVDRMNDENRTGEGTIDHENGLLRVQVPVGSQSDLMAISDFISATANTKYELDAWLSSEAIYGSGAATITWYEDDGAWHNSRALDLYSGGGSVAWQPIRKTITTLPSTRRVLIKTGLWQAYGTLWIDALKLVKMSPSQSGALCPTLFAE